MSVSAIEFKSLTKTLRRFYLARFTTEADIERALCTYLRTKNIPHVSQRISSGDRYDVICGGRKKICIEIKVRAQTSDLKQFDRYHRKFPDGLIILCWSASPSLRGIFDTVTGQSPTPVELIELSETHSLV